MNIDDNLKKYVLKALLSPNVITFASEKARNLLSSEFGLTISSLLRPLSVESSNKFLWPIQEGSKKNQDEFNDPEWQERDCREIFNDFFSLKELLSNKPLSNSCIWVPQNRLEEININLADKEYKYEDFEVKFISLCEPLYEEFSKDFSSSRTLKALKSYDGFAKLFPYTELISNIISNRGGKHLESAFKELLQNNFKLKVNEDMFNYNNELPFWFQRWYEAFHEELSFLNHENISQPIGGIIFVDISEDDPVESIIEITNSLKTGTNFENIGGNSDYYLFGKRNKGEMIKKINFSSDKNKRLIPHYLQESYLNDFPIIYIFINDESSNFNFRENDQNIISSFKLSFPESICYIWNIKGKNIKDLDQQVNFVVYPGTFSHPFKEVEHQFIGNRYFLCDEMEQLNSFVIDSIKNVFIPWLEATINRLYNLVTQSRKGLKNHLRILWRRPRNDSSNSNSEGLLSTLGVGTAFSNIEERSQIFEHEISLFGSKQSSGNKNSNPSNYIYYSSNSLEGQTRLLADLCLISGICSHSIYFYKQILSEYKLDKSFLHIGSTLFSMAIAQILTNSDIETISNSFLNSSNSFQKNNDQFGTIFSIKPLLLLIFVLFKSSVFKENSNEINTSSNENSYISLSNIYKNLIDSLFKVSNEIQLKHRKLTPRFLFSISKIYLSKEDSFVLKSGMHEISNLFEVNIFSIFAVVNYLISRILNYISNNFVSNGKFQDGMDNYSHYWILCTAQAARTFQDLDLFGLSLQNYLLALLQINRFSYKHIESHFKLYSARLCQKLALLPQSTVLYANLMMDIINEQVISTENPLIDNNEFKNFGNKVNLTCYREFLQSFIIYKERYNIENQLNQESSNNYNLNIQLKIPLPLLLPFGSIVILETDSDSLSKTFGLDEEIQNRSNNCICDPNISSMLKQKSFCNHNGVLNSENLFKDVNKSHFGSFDFIRSVDNNKEIEFQKITEKISNLLEKDEILDGFEITELKSQYLLRRQKENHKYLLNNNSEKFLISSAFSNNSTRFSCIGKMCSIEFYLYNPLSFPILCESLQIWGHLRLHDGSTSIAKISNDSEINFKDTFFGHKGIIFFEKSIVLNPNETKLERLSVLPLESGELFLVGISFLLDGKIPIKQNFGTSSINFDKLALKFELISNSQNNYSKDHFGIQKINILNYSEQPSILFGNIKQKSFNNDILYDDCKVLYSGIKYSIPIKISNESINSLIFKDIIMLVIPFFTNDFNIKIESEKMKILNIDNSGGIYRLKNIINEDSHEFELSIWVNSECKGNLYFILLNSNKTDDQHGINLYSKTKVNRSMILGNLNFFFKNSVSLCCNVFPGEDNLVNKILLRVKNHLPKEIGLFDISAYPSKWIEESHSNKQESKLNNCIPILKFALNNSINPNNVEYLLNGNSHFNNYLLKNDQFKFIPSHGTFQIFLDLHLTEKINWLSLLRIDIVFSWFVISSNESDLTENNYLISFLGQNSIYDISLSDPHMKLLNNKFQEKYQPLLMTMNIKDSNHKDRNIDIIETEVTITNITINSIITCSLICNSSTHNKIYQEDLLTPSEVYLNEENNQLDSSVSFKSKINLNKTLGSVLESGELKWIGPTVTHIKLNPRSSKKVKLIAIIPFKGIFSTSSIQLIIRDKFPYFHLNEINIEGSKSVDLKKQNQIMMGFMKWKPIEFKENPIQIVKSPIMNILDLMDCNPTYSDIKIYSDKNKNLPAYITSKNFSNKKSLKIKNKDKFKTEIKRTLDDSVFQITCHNQTEDQNYIIDILDHWLLADESEDSNIGNIHISSYSNILELKKIFQENLRERSILRNSHSIRFIAKI